jgi:1-acyl-sn-glycerol-3-phosphate acyltransferase
MYAVLRACLRAGLHLYCGRIRVEGTGALHVDDPMLLACNHPNTFLDALIVATHLPWRMRFLVRGEAFRNPLVARALRSLFMIPLHRLDGGRSGSERTGESLHQAQAELERGSSVLIFPERPLARVSRLRPLGKGTARIAYRNWQAASRPADVLPVWLRYADVNRPFKEVYMVVGEPMTAGMLPPLPEPIFLRRFNDVLGHRLLHAAEMADTMHATGRAQVQWSRRPPVRELLLLPAFVGLLLHAPWYMVSRILTAWCVRRDPEFFGSMLFSVLFLSYPLWLAILAGISVMVGSVPWAIGLVLAAPLSLAALRAART